MGGEIWKWIWLFMSSLWKYLSVCRRVTLPHPYPCTTFITSFTFLLSFSIHWSVPIGRRHWLAWLSQGTAAAQGNWRYRFQTGLFQKGLSSVLMAPLLKDTSPITQHEVAFQKPVKCYKDNVNAQRLPLHHFARDDSSSCSAGFTVLCIYFSVLCWFLHKCWVPPKTKESLCNSKYMRITLFLSAASCNDVTKRSV